MVRVCFICLKVGHIIKKYKTRTPTPEPSNENDKVERKNTLIEVVRAGRSRVEDTVITQSYGVGDHTTSH